MPTKATSIWEQKEGLQGLPAAILARLQIHQTHMLVHLQLMHSGLALHTHRYRRRLVSYPDQVTRKQLRFIPSDAVLEEWNQAQVEAAH